MQFGLVLQLNVHQKSPNMCIFNELIEIFYYVSSEPLVK